jgi:plastocyanin
MKNVNTIFGLIIVASCLLASCGQNSLKQKELDLKEKELALKERELALKEKDSPINKTPQKTNSETTYSSTGDYNYAGHSEFKNFWSDFKKAVNSGDKDAVAKMTIIPFKDKNRENLSMVQGIGKPLTSKTINEFKVNFNKIFSTSVVKTLNSNKFITWETRSELNNSSNDLKKGEYYLFNGNTEEGLLFSKREGVYKLICIPSYDMTMDAN